MTTDNDDLTCESKKNLRVFWARNLEVAVAEQIQIIYMSAALLEKENWMLSPPTQKCRYRRNETKDSHDQELGTQKHVPRAACFLLSRTFWWQLSSMDIHFSTTITMTTDDDDLTCEPSKNLRVLLFRCNLILILVSGTFCYFSLGWLRVTLSFPS